MAEVGKAEVRVDAFDKATGRTKYYEDLMPRDALYVRIKHATIAHGFVKSVDTSAAEQIPGVVKVLTCFDVPEHPFPTAGHPWSMDPGHQDVADRHLLNRHVRYYGDDVAVVIAENEVAAMQGRTASVLLETPLSATLFTGYTKQYLPVLVSAPGHKTGDIVNVMLGAWDGRRCRAEIVGK